MATQTNLLGYFGNSITRERKCQSCITAFLTKSDGKVDHGVVYLGSKQHPFYIEIEFQTEIGEVV